MPPLRAAVLSDAHLQGLEDPAQHRMVALLDALETERLYLLGDLFHFWWGFRGAVMSEFVPALAALHRVTRRGVPITYVPGNHDFALGPFFKDALGVTVSSEVREVFGGRRYVMLHGDEADTSAAYALTRAVLRGPAFAALMRLSGPAGARRIGLKLAGASREHGGDPTPLIDAQKALAAEKIRAGADVVVVGHTHRPGVEALEGGGTFINLGDFHHHRTWLAITEEGHELRRWPE
jgi:UDP-2,3-diacylglucosamine hydrolase